MNDTSMSDASRMTSTSLEHATFPHLSSIEWEALHRLAAESGDAVIQTLLTAGTEEQQRLAAQEFMARELADLRRRVSTPTQPKNKTDIVKLDVSTYNGEGAGRLHLNRWFCEMDITVDARQLSTELARTRFLLSKLGGKAKEWALGKLVADATCFPTMASIKSELRLAFEPPQDENIQRSAFLSLKQGRMSMLEYIQHTRHLVSCITTHPMDMATQVHVFVSGLKAGYQRFYLKRKPPSTLEEAFVIALREDYSVTASQAFDVSRPLAHEPGPEPMEVDTIQHYGGRRVPTSSSSSGSSSSSQSSARTPRPLCCFRCKKLGHRAAVCRAPAPVVATVTTHSDATISPPAKKRRRPVGAGRPTGSDKGDGSLVAEPSPSPPVLRAHLSATTSGSDSRLIASTLRKPHDLFERSWTQARRTTSFAPKACGYCHLARASARDPAIWSSSMLTASRAEALGAQPPSRTSSTASTSAVKRQLAFTNKKTD